MRFLLRIISHEVEGVPAELIVKPVTPPTHQPLTVD